MKVLVLLAMLTLGGQLHAAAARSVSADILLSSDGTKVWNPPASSDTIVGRQTTDTLQNKTISGASNTLTAIPASALTGAVAVANGGTGLATLTLNGVLFGNGTSAAGLTSAGSQYQLLQAGSGGVPTFGALQLGQSAAVSGALGIANGGTGQTTASAAINALLPSQSSANGYFLTSNGTSASWASIPTAMPTINGSQASPVAITAANGIQFSGAQYFTTYYVQGSGGAVTVSASSQIAAGSAVGQRLRVVGTSSSNTVTLSDGSGLSLNGPITLGSNSAIEFDYNGSVWTEVSRR